MRKVFIDESSGNPFPPRITLVDGMSTRISPASTEGYYHNDKKIKATAKRLAEIVNLRRGQRTIDVGYGSNLSVAEAMRELGMDSYGLDSQDGLDRIDKKYQYSLAIPPHFNAEQNGIRKYCGTIEDIVHPESELKAVKFDLFIFWGSWESGGYNFAGGEARQFRVMQENPGKKFDYRSEELYDLIQANQDKVLKDSSSLLNSGGGIMVVSSRYAGHGAGFATDQLPLEKRIMLRLGQTFSDLGAQELYLIGVSKGDVQRQLGRKHKFSYVANALGLGKKPKFADVAKALGDDSVLFGLDRGIYEAKYPDRMLRAIKDMQVPLGRIDAVYGKF